MVLPDSLSNTGMEGGGEGWWWGVRTKKNEGRKKQTRTAGECSREGEEGGQATNRKKKRIVKGGLEREADENRKHSVCKQQIKNLSARRTKPRPRGHVGLSASYSEQMRKYSLSLAFSQKGSQ